MFSQSVLKANKNSAKYVKSMLFSGLARKEIKSIKKFIFDNKKTDVISSLTNIWMLKQNQAKTGSHAKFSQIVSTLCINTSSSSIAFACDVVECVHSLNTENLLAAYLELIDGALNSNNVDGAMIIFSKIIALHHNVGIVTAERLLSKVVGINRFDHVHSILTTQYITNNMMLMVAEPLIMFGKSESYSQYLEKYLLGRSLPNALYVMKLMKAMDVARLRRSNALPDLSYEEVNAVNDMYSSMQRYLDRLAQEGTARECQHISSCHKILHQMFENEEALFHVVEKQHPFQFREYSPFPATVHVPNLVRSSLLTEDVCMADFEAKKKVKLKGRYQVPDITSELCRRHPHSEARRLYDSRLFPGDLEQEIEDVAATVFMDENAPELIAEIYREAEEASAFIERISTDRGGKNDTSGDYYSDEDDEDDEDEFDDEDERDQGDTDDRDGNDMEEFEMNNDHEDEEDEDDDHDDDDEDEEYYEYDEKKRSVVDRDVYARNALSRDHDSQSNRRRFLRGMFCMGSSENHAVCRGDISEEMDSRYPGFFLQFKDDVFNSSPSRYLHAPEVGHWDLRIPYSEYRFGVNGIVPMKQPITTAATASKEKTRTSDTKNVKVVAPLPSNVSKISEEKKARDWLDNLLEGER